MPFTLSNIKEDLEDIGPRFDGAPDLEFRAATKALELEKSALSYQRVPPGYRFPYGHTHETQEEVYVVLRGSGRMKVDDELVELKEWDAVRVPPGTWRGYEAGPEGLEILVIGAPDRVLEQRRLADPRLAADNECSTPRLAGLEEQALNCGALYAPSDEHGLIVGLRDRGNQRPAVPMTSLDRRHRLPG